MRSNQKGFVHIGTALIIATILVAVVAIGLMVAKKGGTDVVNKITNKNDSKSTDNRWLDKCESHDRKPMTHLPMNIGDVESISPYGLTAGAHVTPIDHLYMYPKGTERDKFPVYAMADGYIVEVSSRGVNVSSGENRPPEYRIIFQHSCQTVSYFDLVTKLDDSISKQVGELKANDSKGNLRIPVKAGQEIGRIGAQSLDTAVYNFDMKLKGFIHPEMYKAEFWKVHTDDFYSYFSQSNQDTMQTKNRRKVKPYSGKIDYDQPGKLIGNWFKEGTNGYAGPKESQGKPGSNDSGYWNGHLAIFYDAINTTQIDISIGQYQGKPTLFAVKGNAPDPATISQKSGITKYELIMAPNSFFPNAQTSTQVVGTILFEVLPNEKLKLEIFPDKTASQVSGFTPSALTYER